MHFFYKDMIILHLFTVDIDEILLSILQGF